MRDLEFVRADDGTYRRLWDDFKDGFTVGTPTAKWFYFRAGSFTGDDGMITTGPHGLTVVSPGRNSTTGDPAFTLTLAPDSRNGGLAGGLDHVKWLAYANHTASSGHPGFDAVTGQVLSLETWLGGRTYGTRFQPFGGAVDDPDDDLRLASFAANLIDFETYAVFDFFLTNKTIYAFYERLPFGRGPALGDNYAAFSFQIPVAANHPRAVHHLRISYDRAAGTVRWYVDEEEVFGVDRIGCRIDRRYLTLDHGGEDVLLEPRQLACGMGMFTLLDGYCPTGTSLVKLGDGPTGYFDPNVGEPTPSTFVDPSSLPSSRLFGQGARLDVRRVVVSSTVGT
ncbi:hypothetical protein SAMN05421678_11436 [Actinopolymorpha cephalotaxi]|uniref:Uncharacterized protein n=1 Tax=Actinopolymorpha cephalotaxi TaxID=504797 RepID=A0A1I2YCX8_9ACTN|nr:DUF6081 family protein [Actinopolymorpha cephalotaxi]NYH87029.1 hypothetical protein [Actinopolymorpha cephalotaxi]SFH23584.1 hypothetical protein SAMN05421678_11436 [Actinopolymorpha cephalotaxi]